jgi:hypothetical protein
MTGKRISVVFYLAGLVCLGILFASCKGEKKTVFKKLSSSETGIEFVNKPEEHQLFNILYYLYYYNGGGVAAGDINNDGLTDLYFTANNKGGNKLYINKGNFQFEDITDKGGVAGQSDWCSGVTMGDINGDGLLDIYVSAVAGSWGLKGHNELFINNGNNTFSERSAEYGLDFSGLSTQAVFFDYDHDGDLDCYLLRHSKKPHANIVDTSNRKNIDSLAGDKLLRNELDHGEKNFTDVSTQAGIYQSSLGYGLGIAIADLNNDGWEDIYVGNDFHENDYYYVNNGDGTFKESSAAHFRHYSRFSMGNDIADYNNDGQLDVVTVDMLPPDEKTLKTYGSDENPDIYKVKLEIQGYQKQYSKNCLQRNNGNGISFSETALVSGVSATDWSWAPLFADFDNDAKKDLLISSGIVKRPVDLDYIRFVSDLEMKKGFNSSDKYDQQTIDAMPDGASHPFLYKGDGLLSFTDVSNEWGTGKLKGYFNGAAYADLDNDGNLDIVMNCLNEKAVVLKNTSSAKNYLQISFQGDSLNKNGIGTKTYLFSNGQLQYQQLMLTRGFESSVEPRLHFGLGDQKIVDSILIIWPDQRYQLIKNAAGGKKIAVKQAEAGGKFVYADWFKPKSEIFQQINLSDWRHIENDFLDYNVQYLIPHMQSTRGPKIAVADVNGDGLDDMYVCGAKNQPGALLIQQPGGNFKETNKTLFDEFAVSEDVDAIFFDANNDKFPDLLVVSGGNEVLKSSKEGLDRLYLNDGKGNFTKAELPFANQFENKSCVAVCDFDKDGDNDFFIGNLCSQTAYGKPVHSYLYINRGNGKFDMAERKTIFLQSTGMVTSAAFADVDNNNWPDLIITGEFMPLKIFLNDRGVFKETSIPNSTGLWQSIHTADVNGDGNIDILAGNWGYNCKLWAGKNGPVKLYVKDFDNNGSIEQVLCYTISGKEYTFLAKDELERSLPILKKAYLKYSDVAGKTVQYMFYDLFKDYAELKAETLSSSCFLNNGKGNFTRVDLPEELQLAPVMAFASAENVKKGSFIAAGNFYGVIPYEGRYDALQPTVFSYEPGTKKISTLASIPSFDGEARDIKWLNAAGGKKIMVIARNNNTLQFYRANE